MAQGFFWRFVLISNFLNINYFSFLNMLGLVIDHFWCKKYFSRTPGSYKYTNWIELAPHWPSPRSGFEFLMFSLCQSFVQQWRWLPKKRLFSSMNGEKCSGWKCTANPTWGDIFKCCFKAQSSKLEHLFSLKRGKRDVRALSFELLKMSPQVGLAVHTKFNRNHYPPKNGLIALQTPRTSRLSTFYYCQVVNRALLRLLSTYILV